MMMYRIGSVDLYGKLCTLCEQFVKTFSFQCEKLVTKVINSEK